MHFGARLPSDSSNGDGYTHDIDVSEQLRSSTLTLQVDVQVVDVYCQPSRSSRQGDLRLSGPPTSQDDDDGARTRNRRVSADFRVDSLATEPPTPKLFGPRQIRTRAK
ncbi:hypothetical protein PoB_006308900 [Plakobranchus ocellatus]|uniref:Uncharacterized protein n=1 Tax=Plakobranchus ocellatus TaxID=259542 RepID=A0AAV4CXG0_9GAST|nr:hypothetical protein PoB_006308900 [Plakobranchus ocellatus]